MYKALLWKDYRLLQTYVRISILSTLAFYLVCFAFVYFTTQYTMQEASRTWITRLVLTLSSASISGLVLTVFLASIFAGSSIALERADRSSEFLACLPPSRMQNLLSKLTVNFVAIGSMLVLNNLAGWVAWQLLPNARIPNLNASLTPYLLVTAHAIGVGGVAFSCSALSKSNGAPTLLGLGAPLISLAITLLLGLVLKIPSEGNAFVYRYALTSVAVGCTGWILGSYWYLTWRQA